MADLHVMYQPLDGGWVKLGTQHGGGRGVVAESIRLEGDRGEGGCLSCSFKLKQDPRLIATQMEKATPIVVMDGAEAIWSGRIAETPMTFGEDDIEVGVNAQGWWQHLKDDCTDREWVISDLSRAQPVGKIGTNQILTEFNSASDPSIDAGMITIPIARGATLITGGNGVTWDLGPNHGAARAVVTFDIATTVGSANFVVYLVGHTTPMNIASGTGNTWHTVDSEANPTGGTVYTMNGTFNAPYRYVSVYYIWGAAATVTGAEHAIRIRSAQIFTDTADESGNASILKASTIISETLDACAPLISPRRDRITTTALSLPQFPGSPGWRYADELIRQANAPHGYLARLTPDPVPVFEYGPIPTDYRFVLGEGQYTLLEPAAQALQGVASRVITEFEDAAGVRSYAAAYSASGAGNSWNACPSSEQFTNANFDSGTTGWSATQGSIAVVASYSSELNTNCLRGTGEGLFGYSTANNFNYRVLPGKAYRLTLDIQYLASATLRNVFVKNASTGATLGTFTPTAGTGVMQKCVINFTAPSDGVGVYLQVTGVFDPPPGQPVWYIDNLVLSENSDSVVSRRGFRRTFLRPMSQRSTLATAEAIADLELDAAQYPPFKGTIGVTGRIPLKGGGTMDVSHLPALVGENVLLANLHDPNSQALGRIGNIQSVVYDHDKRQAILGIDRDLSFITELRNRLAIFAR